MRDGKEDVLLEAVKQHIEEGNIDVLTTVLACEQYKVTTRRRVVNVS